MTHRSRMTQPVFLCVGISLGFLFRACGSDSQPPEVIRQVESYAELRRSTTLPVVRLPEVLQAPTLDGRQDRLYNAAETITFRYLSGLADAPTQATFAYLITDRRKLYLFFDCRSTVPKDLREEEKIIQVFLDPTNRREATYFHLITNTQGAIVWRDDTGRRASPPDLHVVTRSTSAGWTAEIAIPFKALGIPPRELQPIWAMNLARRAARPEGFRKEDTGWAPTGSHSAEVPSKFGYAWLEVARPRVKSPE